MRRRVAALLFITLALAAGMAAFGLPSRGAGDGWHKIPEVTAVSSSGDPRLPVVQEAVDFWNRAFAELGSAFRLGAVHPVIGELPDADLQALSASTGGPWLSSEMFRGAWLRQHPVSFERFPGDLLVVLSDAKFISFSSRIGDRSLVAIKSGRLEPLTMPNVLQNVIAHELGHALGLGHNSDPTTLMCGRPAPCRPNVFASDTPHFFPLTDDERARLRRLYPPTWAP